MDSDILMRRARLDDADAILRLFDEAIAWFIDIGNTEQWGVRPFSEEPKRVSQVQSWLSEDGAWVAEHPELGVCGTLVLGDANDYAPPVNHPELYVRLLLGSRAPEAKGVGRSLLKLAEDEARRQGVARLRVDCFAGGTGKLVEFYEKCGYRRTQTIRVGTWPGQILERNLEPG